MVSTNPKNLVPQFFGDTARTYDKIVRWTTFGKDKYWKTEILNELPRTDSFLDLACGTGILTRKVADKFPKSLVVGLDISQSYLSVAKHNSKLYDNISFILQDAEQLNLNQKFGCIISSYIPKYCDPDILVENCKSHLKPGGTIILHDFTYPSNTAVKNLWNLYFYFLRVVGFLVVPSWKTAFAKLPQLIRTSSWLSLYNDSFQKRGFKTRQRLLTWDSSAILIAYS